MPCQPEALGEFSVKLLTAAHMPGAVGRMNAAAAIRRAEMLDEILQASPCTPAVVAVTPSDVDGVSVAPIPDRDVVVVNDAGRTIVIPGIVRFAFARSALSPKTRALLDRVALNLRDATAVRIEIIGHTDRHGSAKANRRPALRRASNVRRYLARAGLSTVQIVILSRGESALLDPRHTPQADARNRRAELRVFTNGGPAVQFEPDTATMQPLRRTKRRAPRRTSTPPPPVTAR
jgi:outer membrane protein OmpA-like peptidoglycan-associated protein